MPESVFIRTTNLRILRDARQFDESAKPAKTQSSQRQNQVIHFVAFFAIFASLRTLRSNRELTGVGCGEPALGVSDPLKFMRA